MLTSALLRCRREDSITAAQVRELVDSPALRAACPVPFDEAHLWQGEDGPRHKARAACCCALLSALACADALHRMCCAVSIPQDELRAHFRNISAVMDCIGCEKCRLWGKLQTLGLGTALKVSQRRRLLMPATVRAQGC